MERKCKILAIFFRTAEKELGDMTSV